MKVFIYFNLHRKCWSVKALEGNNKGRVISHVNEFALINATFKVSETGRQRVLREKRKNVHAGIVGTLWNHSPSVSYSKKVSYNPYKANTFFNVETNQPVLSAGFVIASGRSVTYME